MLTDRVKDEIMYALLTLGMLISVVMFVEYLITD